MTYQGCEALLQKLLANLSGLEHKKTENIQKQEQRKKTNVNSFCRKIFCDSLYTNLKW